MMPSIAFDSEFYVRQLAGQTISDHAWDHYCTIGHAQGLCPHPDFDPVSYKLANAAEQWEEFDPWSHFHAVHAGRKDKAPPPIAAHFPGVQLDWRHMAIPENQGGARHAPCSAEEARRFAQAHTMEFAAAGARYTLVAPAAEEFMEAVRRGEGFAFIKYPHGFWTSMRLFHQCVDMLEHCDAAAGLSARELHNAAARLARQLLPPTASPRAVFVEGFLSELMEDMAHEPPPSLWRGVAFKGYPTVDERVFIIPGQDSSNDSLCAAMTSSFARFFSPADRLLDGTVIKRWAVSGGLRQLPLALQKRPVAIVGPSWFADTGARWGLASFQLIRIPYCDSFTARYTILERVSAFLRSCTGSASPPPAVLFHCGGCLAAWLIVRLHAQFPNAMLVDVGQGLITWHLEEPFYNYPWVHSFKRAMVENNELESMYQSLAGPHFEQWLSS